MRRGRATPVVVILVAVLAGGGCSKGTSNLPPCESDCPELLVEFEPAEVPLTPVSGDPAPVRLGFFLSVEASDPLPAFDRDLATQRIADVIDRANQLLGMCDIAIELETAAVVALPTDLLDIQANEPGSYGGHPPEDVDDVEQFSYEENETLTPETRKLFEFGKTFTSPNTISAFTVAHIEYYAGGSEIPTGASALSFPPNSYHRVEDYPARNSVLLAPIYSASNPLPDGVGNLPLAHELGHMLLNRGDHPIGRGPGGAFSNEECASMQQNLPKLYGETPVVDPGRP